MHKLQGFVCKAQGSEDTKGFIYIHKKYYGYLNLYGEWLANESLEGREGFKIGETIKYGEMKLLSKKEDTLQDKFDWLVETGKNHRMEINVNHICQK